MLDAMLPAKAVAGLRRRGVDAAAIDGVPSLAGLGDAAVLDLARAQRRAVVTANHRDFRPLGQQLVAVGSGHCGIILLPGHRRDVGWLVRSLAELAAAHPGDDDLRDREVWL